VEGETRDLHQDKAVDLVVELSSTAADLLEGRLDLLEKLLEQLVLQRLPDKDLGAVYAELQDIITRGVKRYLEKVKAVDFNPSHTVPHQDYPSKHVTSEPPDPILEALAKAFPGSTIHRNWSFHGAFLPYYLPEHRLAVAIEGRHRAGSRQEYYCRQEGILLVWLPQAAASDPRWVARILRQTKALAREPN
jgi:hypothetical protein